VQAQIPGIPKEHIELLTKRLREEMLKSVDVVMGWKRQANSYGTAVGFLGVIILLDIPAFAKLFWDFMLIGTHVPLGPRPMDRWVVYLTSWIIQAFGVWMLFSFIYRPLRNAVSKKVLQILRETNGESQPIPYIVQSLVSGTRSLVYEIRRSFKVT
jgi:hypothetical protein